MQFKENHSKNIFTTSSDGNSRQEEKNGDSDNDDKPAKMKMIAGTGKNKLKANNFPVLNHGNSSKETTLKDNEDVSASQNFRNNGKHFYMKKNKKTIEQETTTTTVMQKGNGQQKMSITVKKKEVIEITCSICCTDNNDNISWAVIKS